MSRITEYVMIFVGLSLSVHFVTAAEAVQDESLLHLTDIHQLNLEISGLGGEIHINYPEYFLFTDQLRVVLRASKYVRSDLHNTLLEEKIAKSYDLKRGRRQAETGQLLGQIIEHIAIRLERQADHDGSTVPRLLAREIKQRASKLNRKFKSILDFVAVD